MHNLGSRGVIPEALKGVAWYPYLKNYEGVQEDYRMLDDKMITMDGYDDCMLGICMRFGQDDIVAYDYTKIIQKHIDDGMTDEEAVEFFNFNQLGAWVGEHTPCFILLDKEAANEIHLYGT
jgi:hypothetical protein